MGRNQSARQDAAANSETHEQLLAEAMTLEELLRRMGGEALKKADYLKILLDTARNGSVEISLLQGAVYDKKLGLEAVIEFQLTGASHNRED